MSQHAARLSDETFILFDSCTKTNHFLLGKMLGALGRVTSFFFFPVPEALESESHLCNVLGA